MTLIFDRKYIKTVNNNLYDFFSPSSSFFPRSVKKEGEDDYEENKMFLTFQSICLHQSLFNSIENCLQRVVNLLLIYTFSAFLISSLYPFPGPHLALSSSSSSAYFSFSLSLFFHLAFLFLTINGLKRTQTHDSHNDDQN